ncbi:AfsR/SARP family transcriptional regulator [Antribacter soli]|uniref:AfsR/SARP family transcriptional regulator n=1 Tax=Antribacter soli TaxID=2910976 RepID=UPI0027DEBAA4|nr:BTAD domain-containing putative transcriptional regulator [Antribacter soli]
MPPALAQPASHGTGRPRERVRVLGPVEVLGPDDVPAAPRGRRASVLVTLLALASPRPVPVASLVDALWGDDLPADPRAALQSLVSRLRVVSPDAVRFVPGGYVLGAASDLGLARAAADEARALLTDADLAPDLAEVPGGAGRVAPARRAAVVLDEALDLWRGEPGADLAGTAPDVAAELRLTAEALRGEVLALRRAAARAAGDHVALARLSAAAFDADPVDEDAARDLMTALAANGRTHEAVRVFGRLRHALVVELGTDPSPDVVALHSRLAQETGRAEPQPGEGSVGTATATATAAGAERPASGGARNGRGLRAAPNALLGRERDVAAVAAALDAHRLVTVLGPGGLGKTRLAQEVGARELARPGGPTAVVVVELAGVRTDDDVVLALADGLGLSAAAQSARMADRMLAGDLREQLVERARSVPTLLVLDNCEHVAAGAARWTGDLLTAAPDLRVLATSRAPLELAAEQAYPLAPLASADGGRPGPAVELFRQRARAARPGVALPDDVVARLCARLDGLPLAIELAAARVRTLPVEDVERHLRERFALLRGGDRTAPDRHRTLEAVIGWSWNLLEPAQQELWRRVSVLPDGVSAHAAAALGRLPAGPATRPPEVPLDVLDDIDGLVAQSLLAVTEDGGVVRYRMLETVREFGLLRLAEAGEQDAVRDALSAWALDVARRCTSDLLGPGQVAAVTELRREHENLLFALREAAQETASGHARRPDVVVQVFAALGGSWSLQGAEERAAGLAPAVLDAVTCWPVPEASAEATALALMYAAATQAFSGPAGFVRALARLRRVLRAHDTVGTRTRAVAGLLLARDEAAMRERVAALLDHEDPFIAFVAHLATAQEAENTGRLDEAMVFGERAYALAAQLGDVACSAVAAMFLSSGASEAGDTRTGARWSAEARVGLTTLAAEGALRQLDWVDLAAALDAGDLAEAERICRLLEQAGDGADDVDQGRVESRAVAVAGRGEIAFARGDVAEALARYERAVGSFVADPSPSTPWAVLLSAAWVVRLVRAGDARAGAVVGAMCRRVVRLYREWMPRVVDHPVLGTACVGAGVYLALGTPPPGAVPGPALGLELLALAEALGSRQDLRALRRQGLLDAAVARHGATAVEAARARVAQLGSAELPQHAMTVLDGLSAPDE